MADGVGLVGFAAILLAASCAHPDVGTVAAATTIIPEVRVGVVPSAPSVRVGGGVALMLRSANGGGLIALPSGIEATIEPGRGGLRVRFSSEEVAAAAILAIGPADSGAPVRLNGRDYRGSAVVSAGATGVMAVNVVGMEEYLRGVVGAEMGRRSEPDLAALRAQAVMSRTIGLKRIGQWRSRGFDLLASVADQAYAGVGFETPLSTRAVDETAGLVLTWGGAVIDGFFHSTCGGRTADGTEVFAGADRPYLRSIRDQNGAGATWCAISPRFRWREVWPAEALARTLQETLPAAGGSTALAAGVLDLRVTGRTSTGRVDRLLVVGESSSMAVSGPVARLLLRTPEGSTLRSAQFNLQVTRSGTRIVQLVAEGSGAGHGVGMCQWGAIGRSRAGTSYQDILAAYFPGTQVTRTY